MACALLGIFRADRILTREQLRASHHGPLAAAMADAGDCLRCDPASRHTRVRIAGVWRDILSLLAAWWRSLTTRQFDAQARIAWCILIATIPGALAGYLLNDLFETLFASPAWVAGFLLLTGAILALSERFGRQNRPLVGIGWRGLSASGWRRQWRSHRAFALRCDHRSWPGIRLAATRGGALFIPAFASTPSFLALGDRNCSIAQGKGRASPGRR